MEEFTEQQADLLEQTKAHIEKQSNLFDQCKHALLADYDGLYVLFENGKVLDSGENYLDSGENYVDISMRAYKKGGMRPLY